MQFPDFLMEVRQTYPDAATSGDFVIFSYNIPIGARIGQSTKLALARAADWPLSCPPGPHVSPRLGHPDGAVHESPLGPEWEYWSRPFPGWATSPRNFRTYMGHIRALMAKLT